MGNNRAKGKMKNIYFDTEEQVRKYGKEKGIDDIENKIKHANEDKDYFAPFAEIPGCKVCYVWKQDGDRWNNGLFMSIRFYGVAMMIDPCCEENTKRLKLCDEMDWQGLSASEVYTNSNDPRPNKIGKPTIGKLDDWRTYLLNKRKKEEEAREFTFAKMLEKMDNVCANFPEAKAVQFDKGYWTFQKTCNGFEYTCQINSNGQIYERLDKSYSLADYAISAAEKAARVMDNGLKEVKPLEHFGDACDKTRAVLIERINKFIGGRPNFNN